MKSISLRLTLTATDSANSSTEILDVAISQTGIARSSKVDINLEPNLLTEFSFAGTLGLTNFAFKAFNPTDIALTSTLGVPNFLGVDVMNFSTQTNLAGENIGSVFFRSPLGGLVTVFFAGTVPA